MPVKIGWDNGIVIKSKNSTICFDPQTEKVPYTHIFISHAHQDHSKGFCTPKAIKYSTKITAEIFKAATEKEITNFKSLNYHEKVEIGDLKITVYDAGHIPGSAQYLVETGEETVLYTGDINLTDTLLTKAAEPVKCDILIIESTYGRQDLNFPPRYQTYSQIVKWVLRKIIEKEYPNFIVYPIGKAQEIAKIFNEFTNLEVLVEPKTFKICKALQRFGFKINTTTKLEKDTPHVKINFHMSPRSIPVFATGWAIIYNQQENVFPLSNHADFKQLISYVNLVKPKKVYTCFGFSKIFANQIKKKLGIEAQPLPLIF